MRTRAIPTPRPPPRPTPRPTPRQPTDRHNTTATARARASERRAASGGRRPAGGGRPTDADGGMKPATQVATARRNRASGGGLCVIARGIKEQKPPFSGFSASVPWGLFKSIWCFFCVLLGRQGSRSCGYFNAKMRGSRRRTAKSDRSKLSVTAGNWLSQHGGRSSTRRETVLPRWQKPYPPVCVVFTAW